MSYRSLMAVGGIVLLVAAAASLDVPPVAWRPSWPVRLGLGGLGVLLALGAHLGGRAGATAHRHKPAAEPGGGPGPRRLDE